MMTIGEFARRSGVTVKALRYYDSRGLLPPSGRRPNGYRTYGEADLHRLAFIQQAKALGLTLEAIRELVGASHESNGVRPRPRLLRMLEGRIEQTTRQIAMLTLLRKKLSRRRTTLARRRNGRPGGAYCTCLHDGADD